MRFSVSRTPYCCGLMELGGWSSRIDWSSKEFNKRRLNETGYAYMCVTRWSDIKQKAWLKKNGFKSVGRWKNPNTGRKLTLWVRFPEKE